MKETVLSSQKNEVTKEPFIGFHILESRVQWAKCLLKEN